MAKRHRACTFGRFNLLHIGHLRLFKQMADSCHYLTIGLSDNPKNVPLELRKEVIDIALEDSGIPYSVVPAKNPFDLFDQVKDLGNDDVTAFFGTDQHRLCRVAETHYDWHSSTVDRIASSTSLRVALDEEDWDMVALLAVPGTANHLINLRQLELTN